ncbi:MAG TPA: 30S ribosomal protein S17 [Symbiobacteriaceae bacterium]|nr:30S ribosomal protein S17 [Symbiobacteriaceae bacterium]
MTEERNLRKTRIGVVTSDKMDKTVVVSVETLIEHPLYRKRIKQTAKFKAHDEQNQCKTGDKVRIMETRPLSKDKRWRVVEIVEAAKV